MKISKLLVLSAALLLGSNAAQAVDENVWAEPAPTEFASLVVGETYFFYNVGSGLFFTQGNAFDIVDAGQSAFHDAAPVDPECLTEMFRSYIARAYYAVIAVMHPHKPGSLFR